MDLSLGAATEVAKGAATVVASKAASGAISTVAGKASSFYSDHPTAKVVADKVKDAGSLASLSTGAVGGVVGIVAGQVIKNVAGALIHNAAQQAIARAGVYGQLIMEAGGLIKDQMNKNKQTKAGVYVSVQPEDIPAINQHHIGSLGTIVFQVSAEQILTFDGYGTEMSTRLNEHNVIGAKPKVEVLGVGLIDKKLDILLDASLGVTPADEVEKINKMIIAGKRQPLILGGIPKGYWLIEKASIEDKRLTNAGVSTTAQVALSLKEAN